MGSMNEAGLPVTNSSFYSTAMPSLVVKSIVLEVDKLGSDKHQSWDICRIISPPWGTLAGWWQIWAFESECIGSNFDCSTSDCRTATPRANSLLDPTFRSSWSLGLTRWPWAMLAPTYAEGWRIQTSRTVPSSLPHSESLWPVSQLSCKVTRAISGRWRRCPVSQRSSISQLLSYINTSWGTAFKGPLRGIQRHCLQGSPKYGVLFKYL